MYITWSNAVPFKGTSQLLDSSFEISRYDCSHPSDFTLPSHQFKSNPVFSDFPVSRFDCIVSSSPCSEQPSPSQTLSCSWSMPHSSHDLTNILPLSWPPLRILWTGQSSLFRNQSRYRCCDVYQVVSGPILIRFLSMISIVTSYIFPVAPCSALHTNNLCIDPGISSQ